MTEAESKITNLILSIPEQPVSYCLSEVLKTHSECLASEIVRTEQQLKKDFKRIGRVNFMSNLGAWLGLGLAISSVIATIWYFSFQHSKYWNDLIKEETAACSEGVLAPCLKGYTREIGSDSYGRSYITNLGAAYQTIYEQKTGKSLRSPLKIE